VQASLDSSGRYFSLQSTESGTTLSIGESGGNLATRLGIRTFDLTTPVSRLNFGQGIYSSDISQDLVIKRTDGTTMNINLDGVQTVSDVLSRINNHVANFVPSLRVVASLSTNGNGIVLTAPSGANPIEVTSAGGSQSAWGLGLVPLGQSTKTGSTVGANNVINGLDVSGIEVEGTFTTLTRLQDAIRQGDTSSMEHLVQSLDADIQRLSMSRSVVGTRQQNIVELQTRTEDQQTQLKAVESDEIDADLAAVISNLTARQAALQASLQIMGMSSQMSLFNYL
jgi:flagellar hook-associated protein 3 FlgL